MQIVPIEGGRGRLALARDFIEVAVGKVGTVTASRASEGPPRVFTVGHSAENALRRVASMVWRQRAVLADGVKPFRPIATRSLGAVAYEESSRASVAYVKTRGGRYPSTASFGALRDRPFPW